MGLNPINDAFRQETLWIMGMMIITSLLKSMSSKTRIIKTKSYLPTISEAVGKMIHAFTLSYIHCLQRYMWPSVGPSTI